MNTYYNAVKIQKKEKNEEEDKNFLNPIKRINPMLKVVLDFN